MIVHASCPVTLVGGAEIGAGDLEAALSHAPRLVAADGGADRLLAAGLAPEAVIGDMDSLGAEARRVFGDRMHRIAEQVTTDFDKALRHVAAPLVLAIGVTGGRFDHELAVMHALVRHPDRRCIVLGAHSLVFVCPPDLRMDLAEGSDFSLFPMGPVRARSEGLAWPTDGIDFAPDRMTGTSNRVTGPVRVRPDAALMLTILPRAALAETVRALTGPDGGALSPQSPAWPPRGP